MSHSSSIPAGFSRRAFLASATAAAASAATATEGRGVAVDGQACQMSQGAGLVEQARRPRCRLEGLSAGHGPLEPGNERRGSSSASLIGGLPGDGVAWPTSLTDMIVDSRCGRPITEVE